MCLLSGTDTMGALSINMHIAKRWNLVFILAQPVQTALSKDLPFSRDKVAMRNSRVSKGCPRIATKFHSASYLSEQYSVVNDDS